MLWKLLLVLLVFFLTFQSFEATIATESRTMKVVCYTQYLSSGFIVSDKDASMCTDIVYTGAKIDDKEVRMPVDYRLYAEDIPALNKKGIKAIVQLEFSVNHTRALKENPYLCNWLVFAVINYLKMILFNGVELDWECWKAKCQPEDDFEGLSVCLMELRRVLKTRNLTISAKLWTKEIRLLHLFDWITLRFDEAFLLEDIRSLYDNPWHFKTAPDSVCTEITKGSWNTTDDTDYYAKVARRNNTWIYFNDADSIKVKARMFRDLGVLGVAAYPLENDSFKEDCREYFQAMTQGLGLQMSGMDVNTTIPNSQMDWTHYLSIPIVIIVVMMVLGGIYKLVRLKRDKAKKMIPTKYTPVNRRQHADGSSKDNEKFRFPGEQSMTSIEDRYQFWVDGEIDSGWRNENEPDKEWEIPRGHLKMIELLGRGCYGQVWKCEAKKLKGFHCRRIVAVKTLKEIASDQDRQELLNELEIMKQIGSHPNVVSLLGCCTDRDPVLLVLEYVPGGKLQFFLREWRSERNYVNLYGNSSCLSTRDLISFGYQVAEGMDFLSSRGVVHRDLAARNVLIDSAEKVCKIVDFGFARTVRENLMYEKKSDGRLPIRWLPPESLVDNVYTSKSDVWSFGVLLWEIATLGMTPYPGLPPKEVVKQIRNGIRLEKPEYCSQELYDLMSSCWTTCQKQRPTFSDLAETLKAFLNEELEYVNLDGAMREQVDETDLYKDSEEKF